MAINWLIALIIPSYFMCFLSVLPLGFGVQKSERFSYDPFLHNINALIARKSQMAYFNALVLPTTITLIVVLLCSFLAGKKWFFRHSYFYCIILNSIVMGIFAVVKHVIDHGIHSRIRRFPFYEIGVFGEALLLGAIFGILFGLVLLLRKKPDSEESEPKEYP